VILTAISWLAHLDWIPNKLTNSTSIDPMTGPIHLTIFHTNDMHGRLEAMARLSSFARRLTATKLAA